MATQKGKFKIKQAGAELGQAQLPIGTQFQFGNFDPPWGALNFQKTGNVKKHLRMPKFYLRGGQHFPNYSKIRNV